MRPRFSRRDIRNVRSRYAEGLGDGFMAHSLFSLSPYFSNLIFSKFGACKFSSKPGCFCVPVILRYRAPFKVFRRAVSFVAVNVIDVWARWIKRQEAPSNKPMDVDVAGLVLATERNSWITVGIWRTLENPSALRICMSRSESPDATLVGRGIIAFPARNFLPYFFGMIDRIHDRLSSKSVLWLEPVERVNALSACFDYIRVN